MSFPITDWQFWTVTASAVWAVWVVVKPFLPGKREEGATACSHCAVGSGPKCQTAGPELVSLGGRREG